jgi:diguanylate cyclase (GGDEF)-like protein/PAS domain S-box-containing protein
MRERAWWIYGGVAATALLVYYVAWGSGYLFNLISVSAPILILVGIRIHKPRHPGPWQALALGQILFTAGDVVTYNYEKLFDAEVPFPSVGDALYLMVYPLLALGLFLMVRLRTPGRDWTSLVDSLMVACAVGAASWVFLMAPYWHADQSELGGLLPKLTSMAYPLMDLLLIAVAVRLAVGAGGRARSFLLMLGAAWALFVTDTIYAWILLDRDYEPGSGYLELGWAAFYIGLGMAALHPSMRSLTNRAPERDERIGWARLALLGSAALVPPALRLVQYLRGEPVDDILLIGATFVLFGLVVLRMAGLVRLQAGFAARERALREAGAILVTATNRDNIREAATRAVQALVGPDTLVRVCERDPEDEKRFVVLAGEGAQGMSFSLDRLEPWKIERLTQGKSYRIPLRESQIAEELDLGTGEGTVFVVRLSPGEEIRDLLIVATDHPMSGQVADSLISLSRQLALALESAQLSEELVKRQSEARFASLVKNSSDAVAVVESDTTIRYVTQSAERLLGYQPENLEGRRFSELVHPDDRTRTVSVLTAASSADHELVEFRILHQDGGYRHVETLCTNLLSDPNVGGIVLNTRDISERKQFEDQLAHQAFHDQITGLANRALFRDRVVHAIERQSRNGRRVGVLFMDLDDFKTVNDSLGHAAGDEVLREVGERLRSCLRAADTAARLGGDEFAVLLEDAGEGLPAMDVADRIMLELEAPFQLEGRDLRVTASLGIAISDFEMMGEEGAEELLRNADVAMYLAKERGKGRYQVYEPAMHSVALKRLELKADLQRAIEHEELMLVYQPVVELKTGKFTGLEALLRWRHPTRGIVPPLEFITLAEETGLIIPMGQWVLHEALRSAAELRGSLLDEGPFHMAVNLSARQLQHPSLLSDVAGALQESGFPPQWLILEITESYMMQDVEAALIRLQELKELGVQLAIDDFGTGYSSLNYVRRFPVDILKVDKSFIDCVGEAGEGSALTAAVIELAGILKLRPVAEGIEREEQFARLREMRCDLGQGFFFSKPVEWEELKQLLRERHYLRSEASVSVR